MIADLVSYETIAITMFATMLLMLLTGQRVFGAIGFVAAMAALLLWGDGAVEMLTPQHGNYSNGIPCLHYHYLYTWDI